ncbi:transmembrane protein, putative (macronuclear) [Tetrahymena thermophila SB210]|uniref:Transmembrane protein, putative n=1 Tax=Tetrahymena thermophila (strain SB210) TaxID=312017 RepID=W7XIB2_TETTS|nr:transmembrane protein, putative [Tetrahymena thermophila SB210]EWS74481.1 transmembrane protein, putative [Tetrahymena thermophila SB210]|eukprot:XP_012652966.1 transmembrane protein, putative [Tetrahymena thermophila SB210]
MRNNNTIGQSQQSIYSRQKYIQYLKKKNYQALKPCYNIFVLAFYYGLFAQFIIFYLITQVENKQNNNQNLLSNFNVYLLFLLLNQEIFLFFVFIPSQSFKIKSLTNNSLFQSNRKSVKVKQKCSTNQKALQFLVQLLKQILQPHNLLLAFIFSQYLQKILILFIFILHIQSRTYILILCKFL